MERNYEEFEVKWPKSLLSNDIFKRKYSFYHKIASYAYEYLNILSASAKPPLDVSSKNNPIFSKNRFEILGKLILS